MRIVVNEKVEIEGIVRDVRKIEIQEVVRQVPKFVTEIVGELFELPEMEKVDGAEEVPGDRARRRPRLAEVRALQNAAKMYEDMGSTEKAEMVQKKVKQIECEVEIEEADKGETVPKIETRDMDSDSDSGSDSDSDRPAGAAAPGGNQLDEVRALQNAAKMHEDMGSKEKAAMVQSKVKQIESEVPRIEGTKEEAVPEIDAQIVDTTVETSRVESVDNGKEVPGERAVEETSEKIDDTPRTPMAADGNAVLHPQQEERQRREAEAEENRQREEFAIEASRAAQLFKGPTLSLREEGAQILSNMAPSSLQVEVAESTQHGRHTYYRVKMRLESRYWELDKRYSEFRSVYRALRRTEYCPDGEFPKKHILPCQGQRLDLRRQGLENWLCGIFRQASSRSNSTPRSQRRRNVAAAFVYCECLVEQEGRPSPPSSRSPT